MNRTEQAAARREAELQEALGHLEYFKRTALALDQAMKVMAKDLQVCKKNEPIWEKGSKGLNPVAQALAEEKRKKERKQMAFRPFMLSSGRTPWVGRRKP